MKTPKTQRPAKASITFPVLVFVYGTLKKGFRNHHLLETSKLVVADVLTSRRYRMLDVGFPVMLPGTEGLVQGEVYEVDAETLEQLDRLEGEGRMYHRTVIEVYDDQCRCYKVQAYIGNPEFWERRGGYQGEQCKPDRDGVFDWKPRYLEDVEAERERRA